MLVALFLASRLPIGENPVLLSAVPWLLSAVGVAWLVSPADQPERLQGQVLMIAGAAGVILCAVNAGPLTAGGAPASGPLPVLGRHGERPAWIAAGLLGLMPVLAALGTSSWSPRVQAVGLALGLVLMLFAAGTGFLRALALPATTFLVMLAVGSLSTGQLVRFQWIAAVGAILLSCRALISMVIRDSRRDPLRDPLIMGL